MKTTYKSWYYYVFEYIGITLGTIIMALALKMFLAPNTVAPGGVTGFAIIFNKITGVNVAITILAINVPLFILGIVTLGKSFGIKTLYTTFAFAATINMLSVPVATDNVLLASIFGGVIMGIGLGIIFRLGGTSGGTDLAGSILNKYFPAFSTSAYMMSIDLIVVAFSGIVDKKLETALYSIISLYIIVTVINQIVEGFSYAKAFYIISNHPDKIGKSILDEIHRGVTVLQGRGMYTGEDREVLLCVINRAQVARLKYIVYTIDPNAFVMVTDTHEVLGEGFKKI